VGNKKLFNMRGDRETVQIQFPFLSRGVRGRMAAITFSWLRIREPAFRE